MQLLSELSIELRRRFIRRKETELDRTLNSVSTSSDSELDVLVAQPAALEPVPESYLAH